VGEDAHGTRDCGGTRDEGFEDEGFEDVGFEGVDSEGVGSEEAVEGVNELTDGVGRSTGGSVFWSCLPVSPWWRWNQSPCLGS
jgi:hypothetical protein